MPRPRQSREASSLLGDLERVVHAPGHARVCQAQCGLPGHQPRANQSPCPQGVCWKSEKSPTSRASAVRCVTSGEGPTVSVPRSPLGAAPRAPSSIRPSALAVRALPRDFCLRFHSVLSPANCVAGFGFPICEEALKTRVPGDSQRARGGETGAHGQRGVSGPGRGGSRDHGPTEMWMRLTLPNRMHRDGSAGQVYATR